MSSEDDYDDDESFDAAAFEEESVKEMLTDSSDEDAEELLQFMLSLAASAQHIVEPMMVDILVEDNKSDDSERERGTGSRPGKAKNKARDFKGANDQHIFKNYILMDPSPVYNESDFERRFRMPRAVFNMIQEKIIGKGLFREKVANFSGKKGIHPLVRLTACILRLFAYGDAADQSMKILTWPSQQST
jgi:hypothetical protein